MSKYWCIYCNTAIDENDLDKRPAEVEDGAMAGTNVAVCPWCGESDGLEEADECDICGEAIEPSTHLCKGCAEEMDAKVEGLIDQFRGDWFDSKEKFLDYLESRWF